MQREHREKIDKLLRLCGPCASSVLSVVKLLDFSYTEVGNG